MLFGKDKPKSSLSSCESIPRGVIEELNTIDDKYMKSFAIRSTRALQEHLSRDCLVKVNQSVYSIGTRYFGASKFRNTDWITLSLNNSIYKILKDVSFDKIKVAGSIHIDVADSYKEIWTVIIEKGSKVQVTDIQKV